MTYRWTDKFKTKTRRKLEKSRQETDFHAFSVRQLIAQRARLYELFKVAGALARFDNELAPSGSLPQHLDQDSGGSRFTKVLNCVEQSTSQFLQDIYGLLLSRGKKDGFFVEFGACDGLLISNTLLMEREFGWRGILSEPAPQWQAALRANRKCAIDPRCVWSASGETIEFAEFSDDEYHTQSTAVAAASDKSPVSNRYNVETVSLFDLLQTHNAPQEIDFISIDTEGSEYEILKVFPFDKYRFNFLCVENLHLGDRQNPLGQLMQDAGYRQVLHSVSGHDSFYVPTSRADFP